MKEKVIIIGISGVTCGGKTTTANELNKILPNSKIISQDEYFLEIDDPRHVWVPELNHNNYDILSSLDMEKMYLDILNYIKGKNPSHNNIDNKASFQHHQSNELLQTQDIRTTLYKKIKDYQVEIFIIDGFSIFNYKPLLKLFHQKYYFTLGKEECHRRRLERVYHPPNCPGYFEKCAWPEYVSQLQEVQNSVENVMFFDEFSTNVVDTILRDICNYL